MSEKKIKTITICSSASFYKDLFEIERDLKKLGFKVKLPQTAYKMKRDNDFTVENYKTWFKDETDYKIKTKLMKSHFKKVVEADAILVVNKEKSGIPGYIGGNALMEMVLAFHFKKPIFIYNNISIKLPTAEEVLGLQPIFIDQKLDLIK